MGQRFSTWSCESAFALLGCGIDAEQIARFDPRGGAGPAPLVAVFSAEEMSHCRSLPRPAEGLCAAFCAKEALFKAVGRPYDYAQCELLLDPERGVQALQLAPSLRRELGIAATDLRLEWRPEGHCVATVLVFGEKGRGAASARTAGRP